RYNNIFLIYIIMYFHMLNNFKSLNKLICLNSFSTYNKWGYIINHVKFNAIIIKAPNAIKNHMNSLN
ncbi:hypothetical protein E1M97_12440, partial [Staphylococcus epidermidis]